MPDFRQAGARAPQTKTAAKSALRRGSDKKFPFFWEELFGHSDHHQLRIVAPITRTGCANRVDGHRVALTRGQTYECDPARGRLHRLHISDGRRRKRDSPVIGGCAVNRRHRGLELTREPAERQPGRFRRGQGAYRTAKRLLIRETATEQFRHIAVTRQRNVAGELSHQRYELGPLRVFD